ncbi:IS66 family transposase [uncultured Bacteroides sp.]|uniref:IS66 family transposase n=1 Tax=uncultured Bacteroides sp. TaxID=162156 RepID=UPI002AA8D04C|nr:IS66 family transposase [uncultured Bacteroides sp.]
MTQVETLKLLVNSQLEQIRAQQQTNQMLAESNQKLTEQTELLQKKIDELLSQVAWLNRQLFGRRSEKLAALDPNQLSLFNPTLPAEEQAQLDAAHDQAVAAIRQHESETRVERRNRKLLEDLPVVQVVVEPEGIDLTLYKRIGEERTRTLEFEPGKLYVKEIVRPKYGLKDNTIPAPEGTGGIVIAPLPSSPIYKGLAGASMLAEILLQKYEYHVPFYRQVKEFRHLGIHISESTLSGWFKPVCDLLRPLYEELKRQVLQADYIQVDETTVDVINKEKSQTDKEYLWMTRAVMERLVFFHYDNGSRSQQTVKNLLEPFKGYLQSDGYSAYNVFEEKAGVYLVACLAHIRRHFEGALEENRSLGEHVLKEIQELYRIERMADKEELSYQERTDLRQKLATPIFESLEKWMEQTYPRVLPKSRMGQAIAYAYPLWPRMKRYLQDGRIKIDNNLAENAIRPLTISRKNFLFCGNHQAAENTAVICSLLATCKAQEVNPREWLNDAIAQLPGYLEKGSRKEVKELLPNAWKTKKSNETPAQI